MISTNKDSFAFTLIELSIVLVIIGLIVGGVLVGQDLIRQAQLRGVVSQETQVMAAIYTFRNKYNALPGDMSNATNFWGSDTGCPNVAANSVPKTATCNGNGDGAITGYYTPNTCITPATANMQEMFTFWQHLANAQLIDGQFTGAKVAVTYYTTSIGVNVPEVKSFKNVGMTLYSSANCLPVAGEMFTNAPIYNTIFVVGAQNSGGGTTSYPFLTGLEAQGLDTKYDDGLPGKGKIRSWAPGWAPAVNCASTTNANTATYLVNTAGVNCAVLFDEKL